MPHAPPAAAAPQSPQRLIGLTAGELIQRLGQPALQVREGPGLKLQFRGRSCVLDAYLYPPAGGRGARHPRRYAAARRQRYVSAGLHRLADALLKPVHRPGGRLGDHRIGIGQVGARRLEPRLASPLLPAAIRQLRIIRLRPMRLIGEPANISRNAASSSSSRSASARRGELGARQEGAVRRGRFGEAVPRADGQAIVAAVDAVADRLPKFDRDRPVMLDGQVGDALARIDPVGRADRLRRAGVEAARAAAAMRTRPRPARPAPARAGEDHAEEQPAAMLAARRGWCACPASRSRPPAASGFSITGAVSTNTFSSLGDRSTMNRASAFSAFLTVL